MAYNRMNLLRKIVKVQNVVLDYKQKDVPQVVIYRKYIRDQFDISYATFNNYLSTPAKSELRKLEDRAASNNLAEPTLF